MNRNHRFAWAFFLAACVSLTGKAQEKMQNAKITVDSIYLASEFRQQGLDGIGYLLEEKEYYRLEDGKLYRCVRQGRGKEKKAVVLDPASDGRFKDACWKAGRFVFNADRTRLLLLSDFKPIYRRSETYRAVLWTLDKKGRFSDPWVLSGDGPVQEAVFSPDGEKVAFIRENNLYYADLAAKKIFPLTSDGNENRIRNGHTDWVYEEEFAFTRAFDWRPDSRSIAYLKFDESGLKQYAMTIWGDLYPETYRYKYPKAGEENSRVGVWLYDLPSGKTEEIRLQADSVEYVPRIFWEPTGKKLVLYTLNRHQNHLRIWGVGADGKQEVLYQERNPAYVDVTDNVYFFKDGKRMLLATERDGYNHLYLFRTDGKDDKGVLLTPGMYDVTMLYGVDEANSRVFFQASYSSPANLDVMCVGLDGKDLRRVAPDMQLKGGSTFAYFNKDFSYMILEHSKADEAASFYLYHLSPQSEQLIECVKSNNHIEQTAKKYGFVHKEFLRIPVPLTGKEGNAFMRDANFGRHRFEAKGKGGGVKVEDQVYLQAWMMKPAEIGTARAEGKKYPVLMFLYGGPGSQQVLNSLRPYQMVDYAWYQMLVQQGYIVVCVDNRGTGGRGEAFKKCTYLELGKYETEDQVAAARFLASLPYVDADRIGIWGWSYGGFMSSNCLLRGEGTFRMAMAVAPVTNWKYYDNVYTERFMRTPQENPDGYEMNSPIHYADRLEGAYLLVHGSADDNVHVQNAVDLITALQNAGKQFEFVLYPNKNHGMDGRGGSARRHLYHKLTRFIHDNL